MQEPLRSPAFLLASFLSNSKDTPELVLITGESGCGKTAWCLELLEQARLAGAFLYGLISPAVFVGGRKIGIDLLLIHTGESRHLARRRNNEDQGAGPHTKAWQFDASVLDWANQSLGGLKIGEVLILDELGPLEYLENQGIVNGLKLIDQRKYRMACVTVRPGLLAGARERWPWGEVLDLSQKDPGPQGSEP